MRKTSLRAFLFDFDGVIADSEPLHFSQFRKVLQQEGISLSKSEYYEKYLGLDDRGCFKAIWQEQGRVLSAKEMEELIHRKNEALLITLKGRSVLLPGVLDFLNRIGSEHYLAIVSGALQNEIKTVLSSAGLEKRFHVIIGAEDVQKGKPDPEGFTKAIRLLNRDFVPPSEILLASECLVIEDSPWGIAAGLHAGTKCLAVTNSYPKEKLHMAHKVVSHLGEVSLKDLKELFS